MTTETATRGTGPRVWAVALTLGQPLVWVYLMAATMATAPCGSLPKTGICGPNNEVLVVAVPFIGCSAAVVAAWLLVSHASPRWQAWGVFAGWVVSVAVLRYSWVLANDIPAYVP